MMDRYTVTLTPDARRYGILDRDMYAYCTLMDESKNLLPLEWETKEAAQAWLNMCYRRWPIWEGDRKLHGLVPLRWRPLPQDTSPWDRGVQFYS
jgi:hypothetical protein